MTTLYVTYLVDVLVYTECRVQRMYCILVAKQWIEEIMMLSNTMNLLFSPYGIKVFLLNVTNVI